MKRMLVGVMATGLVLGAAGALYEASQPAYETPTTMKRRIVLHGIDCVLEDAKICPEAEAVIDEAVEMLREDRRTVLIMGGSEQDGTTAAGRAIRGYMVRKGISPERVQIVGLTGSVPEAATRLELKPTSRL